MAIQKILIFSILQLVTTEIVQNNFKILKNQGAASETCLISSAYKTTDLACLASCNSKSECLTVIYDRIQVITNCFMYNRYIKSSDLINSNNFILYEKKFGNYCIKNHKFKFKLTGYYSLLNAF